MIPYEDFDNIIQQMFTTTTEESEWLERADRDILANDYVFLSTPQHRIHKYKKKMLEYFLGMQHLGVVAGVITFHRFLRWLVTGTTRNTNCFISHEVTIVNYFDKLYTLEAYICRRGDPNPDEIVPQGLKIEWAIAKIVPYDESRSSVTKLIRDISHYIKRVNPITPVKCMLSILEDTGEVIETLVTGDTCFECNEQEVGTVRFVVNSCYTCDSKEDVTNQPVENLLLGTTAFGYEDRIFSLLETSQHTNLLVSGVTVVCPREDISWWSYFIFMLRFVFHLDTHIRFFDINATQ
jgi:hypothetical protein